MNSSTFSLQQLEETKKLHLLCRALSAGTRLLKFRKHRVCDVAWGKGVFHDQKVWQKNVILLGWVFLVAKVAIWGVGICFEHKPKCQYLSREKKFSFLLQRNVIYFRIPFHLYQKCQMQQKLFKNNRSAITISWVTCSTAEKVQLQTLWVAQLVHDNEKYQ